MYLIVNGIFKYCIMNQDVEYKNNLLKFDLQSFLKECDGLTSIQLKKLYPDTYRVLAVQLALYPKAIHKLPEFTANYCYLTTKSYEQSSSEPTAKYKASLYQGNTLVDLSAGLGIDDIAFSVKFKKIISVDPDSELNLLAEVNFQKLGIGNIERVTARAEDYITHNLSADLIYIDADRRMNKAGKRSVALHDSSPNIPELLNRLFETSTQVLIKLSPLIDITYLKKTLHKIKEIRVISLNNEVKEILVLLDHNITGKTELIAVDIKKDGSVREFSGNTENITSPLLSVNQKYFVEPAASLIKSGLVQQYAEHYGLDILSRNNVFLTTDSLPVDIFGRAFTIINQVPFSKSAFNKYLADTKISQANVSCRNFPVRPDDIKRTFKLSDGGDEYFFFTTDDKKTKLVYHCRKIHEEE
jgi:hypothetical protein